MKQISKNVLKLVWKTVGYSVGVVLFLSVVFAGFTQSKLFKDRLRVFLVSSITANTEATMSLGTIRGNFVTGFSIDSLRLQVEESEFLSTGKISISYDFLSLPRKRIIVNKLTVENPRITLQRNENESVWNVEKVLKPSGQGEPGPFDWTIQVDELELIDGNATLNDRFALASPEHSPSLQHQVEYHDIAISNLNLTCSGTYAGKQAELAIDHLSFESLQPSFELRNLHGDFSVSPSGSEAKSLVLETGHSRLKLSAALEDVNVFDGIDIEKLRHKRTKVSLLADNISLNELKSFIAPIDFLNGSSSIDLNASGEFGNLSVHRLNVQTHNTTIQLSGTIKNLHRPGDLFIDVDFLDSRLTASDAYYLLPPFNIPRFEEAGEVTLNGKFLGKPLNFAANFLMSGNLGTIQTETKLNLENERMEYDCSFSTQNFNIEKVLNMAPLHTSINSRGTVRGTGTSLDEIVAQMKVALDSTSVQDMMLTGSEIVVDAQNHTLQTTATLNSSETKVTLTGKADFKPDRSPLFHWDGEIVNLDLAALFKDKHFRSKISFKTNAHIRGSTIDDLNGNVKIAFASSSFQTHEFGGETSELNIDLQHPDSKYIALHSPVADITLSGNYTLSHVLDLLQYEYQEILDVVNSRTELFEQTGSPSVRKKIRSEALTSNVPTNLQYIAFIKNLRPLSLFLGGTPFNSRGTAHGSIEFDNNRFSAACSASVAEFFVGTVEKGTFFEDGEMVFTLTTSEGKETGKVGYPGNLTFDLDAVARYGIINKNRFDNPLLTVSYSGESAQYQIRSTIDSLLVVDMLGNITAAPRAYDLAIDTMTVTFGALSWTNDGQAALRIDKNGVSVSKFDLRKDKETVVMQGSLDFAGNLGCQLDVRNFDLTGLGHYVKMKELTSERGFTGTFDLYTKIRGTLNSPILLLNTTGENITYRGKNIGTVAGSMQYQDQNLEVDLGIGRVKQGAARPEDVFVRGTIPVNLALGNVDERFPDKPMKLVMNSQGFDIDFLDPLLVTFDNFRGKLSCNVEIGGTPTAPLYNGNVTLSDVQFHFVPNNLSYTLSGKLAASGTHIWDVDVRIANDRKDRSDGIATVDGSLTIRNFTVDYFDLSAHGQLLLMKEPTRKTMREMYGMLFASIGSNGLRYQGSFEQSYLSGTVFIKDANLVFPPTRENTNSTETSLKYLVVDDTTTDDPSRRKLSQEFFAERTNGNSETYTSAPTRTIWDGMTYDVLIETQGTTEIRMVFNQATNEELYAVLEGRVNLQRGESGARIIGEIAVGERSYYNFFKKFSAHGTLKFVGQPDNPELNITASYDGIRILPESQETVADDQQKSEEKEEKEQKVVVTLDITGTRYEPKLSMSMTVDGADWAKGDVESDAIPFILTGKFRDELTSQEKSDMLTGVASSAGSSLLFGLPSQMLSGVLSDFLRNEFGFIRTAEITYAGGNIQESADLRLSGELGRAYWRFGGRIFNDIGNANVSLQLSMGEVLTAPKLNNLFIELERKVEGNESEIQKKLTNAARIFYRISF